jgi:hypothetical protein
MASTRRTRDEWQVLLAEMKSSGLTQRQWCRQRGINYSTMREMKGRIEQTQRGVAGFACAKSDEPLASWVRIDPLPQASDAKAPRAHQPSVEVRIGQITITVAVVAP